MIARSALHTFGPQLGTVPGLDFFVLMTFTWPLLGCHLLTVLTGAAKAVGFRRRIFGGFALCGGVGAAFILQDQLTLTEPTRYALVCALAALTAERDSLIAAAGSAVGLGNLWGFAYRASQGGGGAFLFLYLLIVLVVCLPVLVAEMVLGRSTGHSPLLAPVTAAGPRWQPMGWLFVLAACGILKAPSGLF